MKEIEMFKTKQQ